MSLIKGFDKSERRMILAALAVLAICLFLLFFGDEFFRMARFSNGKEIGTLSLLKNDTRLKPKDTIGWVKALQHEGVEIGDSLFSGASSYAVVNLKKGEQLTVGENSLVVFREVKSEKLADLQSGNFRLKVDGTVKIAIQGEVTTLEGTGSEVQLVTSDKGKPKIRLLKGKAKVKSENSAKPIVLEDTREVASLDLATPAPLPPPAPELPQSLNHLATLSYTWRLYDLYEQRDFQLFPRAEIPESVQLGARLTWTKSKTGKKAVVELDKLGDFREPMRFESSEGFVDLQKVYLGGNFWRVSYEGEQWSSEQFRVQSDFLKEGSPKAVSARHLIPLLGPTATAEVLLSSSIEHIGFVVEAATEEHFNRGETRTFWSSKSTLNLSFFKPGRYFYRFRAVNPRQELTDWSKPELFMVFAPTKPAPPKLLTDASKEGLVGDSFNVAYSSNEKLTEIEVLDEKGNSVAKFDSKTANFKALAAGQYTAVAIARNEYGQRSDPSKPVKILAKEKAKPVVAQKPARKKSEEKRKPAAVESTSSMKAAPSQEFLNASYRDSLVSVQGFLWTMYSGLQAENGNAAPMASGLGVRGLHWWNHSGVEAIASSEVVGLNQSGSDMWLKDFEARYHFRFFTPFPFGIARELQISLFGGVEVYQNTSSEFMTSYDLMTFGTSLEFPLGNRWTTGGELTYGASPNGSSKYEITGNLNYFFERAWSLGIGYKLHLFQAGSSAAPGGYLLYRESYTEGYTSLDYHF